MRREAKVNLGLTALLLVLGLSLGAKPKALGLDENTIEDVAKKVFASVVKVEAGYGVAKKTAIGIPVDFKKVATGVVIDKDGYIVTTALVSSQDHEIYVTTPDGKRSQAKFLGMDPETNLALIQVQGANLIPVAMGKAENLVPGSWVGVISMSPENTPSVTQGIVSSIAQDKLRLNVWVSRGASGSPVVNKEGQMVGLLRGIYSEDQPVVFEFREREVVGSGFAFSRGEAPSSGMALAVPASIVKLVTAEIKEKGKVSRGWMGVSISENDNGQVEVNEVEEESPAELAKLKKGDVLLKLDGKKIASAQAFVSDVRNKKPGQDINLDVDRQGKAVEVKVKLGEYPEGEAQRELAIRFPRLFVPPPPRGEMRRAQPMPEKPSAPLQRAWPQWEKRKYIGVYLEAINKELLAYFGVKEESGLLVNSLTKGGPAEKAGVKVGDVIVRADGKKLATVDDLSALIQDKKKGDRVKLDMVRDKKPTSVEIEVEEEENPGLSFFQDFMVSPEYWSELSKDFQTEYERSRKLYEKYSAEEQQKLKKINEELSKKSSEMFLKSKEFQKDWKNIKVGNRVYYRV